MMGKGLGVVRGAALGAVLLSIAAAPAWAGDLSVRLSGDVRVDAGLILDRWQVELHLGPGELQLLRPVVEEHLRNGGGNEVSRAVHEAQRVGCRGSCLSEVVHQVNGAMGRGNNAGQASDEVIAELRAASREGGNLEIRLHERMKKKHGASAERGGQGGSKPGRGSSGRGGERNNGKPR
ncbi:MAG: hypothetical protein OEY97_06425 [Nitrospirota bacterium]|nr:hypothetical protein [Nitrospirota bacterium]